MYFSKFLTLRKEELFRRTTLGDCFCLVAILVYFLLFFKNIIWDRFYQKCLDFPRAKYLAMFILIATVILRSFNAFVLADISFNDIPISRCGYTVYRIYIYMYIRKYTKFYKFFC